MVVIVYGYEGSGPGHWQRWLKGELESAGIEVSLPQLADPAAPQKDAWVAQLRDIVVSSTKPVTFVCHSLGCWAVDHYLDRFGSDGVQAALLVAPPSPFLIFDPVETFLPPPRRADAWAPIAARSLLVGSDNDDFTSREEFEEIAAHLGVSFHFLPGAGHINVTSNHGPWPFALAWVRTAERSKELSRQIR